MKLKTLFIAALREWPALLWIIAYTTAASYAALLNHAGDGDHRFTVFALCVCALGFAALVALFALIIVTARRFGDEP